MNVGLGRIDREASAVEAMVRIFCAGWHLGGDIPCRNCSALANYAVDHLRACPFQDRKTTCSKCRVHCFREPMRERIGIVERWARPRLFLRHPFLSLLHFIDARRREPLSQKFHPK